METPLDHLAIHDHADLVFRTCLRLTGNAQDAADASQEVFIAWMRARGAIRGPVAAWLHGTARRRSMDLLRRAHRRALHEGAADASVAAAPAASALDDAWRGHLDEALAALDGTSRSLVIEHHLMGVDQGRLATRFRCTQATISRRLAKALEQLRRLLERRGVRAAPAVVPLWLAREAGLPSCPADLSAPVLAQAEVVGAATLLGPAVIGAAWWVAPAAIAGAAALLVALAGGSALWWWRADTLRELDRDWAAVATAHLPPAAKPGPAPAPAAGPRYPSIEALIARLPGTDAARQARVRAAIEPEPGKPWLHLLPAEAGDGSRPGLASDAAHAALGPLLAELAGGDVSIATSGWLPDDYRAGRLQTYDLRNAWLARHATRLPALVAEILIERAELEADPLPVLAGLDAFVRAHDRCAVLVVDGLVALRLQQRRDSLYLRLIYAGRIPPAEAQRWLAEPSPAQRVMADAFLGEVLLVQLPMLDDVRAGRDLGPALDGWHPVGDLHLARGMTWLPERLSVIDQALRGDGAAAFRRLSTQADTAITRIAWPVQRQALAESAKAASAHRARRQAAALLLGARSGGALPDALPALAQGPADAWKLRYERLSPTRFRLVADPTAGIPAYCDEHAAAALKPTTSAGQSVFDDHGMDGIEIEVPPPSVTPDLPPRLDDDEEPLPPQGIL